MVQHAHSASLHWNYRLVIFSLFWVNTFSCYLGNTVNELSLHSLTLLAALCPAFRICLFNALRLILSFIFPLIYPSEIPKNVISPVFDYFTFISRTYFVNSKWSNIQLTRHIHWGEKWKITKPCGGYVNNIAAASNKGICTIVEYKCEFYFF